MVPDLSFIVSDLHLGSEFFRHEPFLYWLEGLPVGAQLVLNGDIIDDPHKPLGTAHGLVLDRLLQESYHRPLIWVYGNHDKRLKLKDEAQIRFVERWHIERRLLIVHGDGLDQLMPKHGLFKVVFRGVHWLRARLGFERVHVAQYAKQWDRLYRVLNSHVARNALAVATRLDFAAITCGHTHAAMEVEQNGRRYFNTGSWTEEPLHYLQVDAHRIQLYRFNGP